MKDPRSMAAIVEAAVNMFANAETAHSLHGVVQRDLSLLSDAVDKLEESQDMPHIVCLCGSTRFYEEFQRANFQETLKGHIVLTVGFLPQEQGLEKRHGETVGVTPLQKRRLDELHKRKIDLADEVLVLNKGGYVGESTRSEIQHALATGKPLRWLEPVKYVV